MGTRFQESLGRAYDIPEDVDEAELDAELEMLGQDMEFESLGQNEGEMPSFMKDEVPTFIDEPPQVGKVSEAAG